MILSISHPFKVKVNKSRPPYQILPHTNSYFHCRYSYLDLLQVAPGVPGGLCPPGVPPGAPGEKAQIAVKAVTVAISMR